MKAKIGKNGGLMIERSGVFTDQYCRFNDKNLCGDACSVWGEIILGDGTLNVYLNCAPQKVGFDHVIDERTKV